MNVMRSILKIRWEKIKKICIVGNLNIDLIIRNIDHFPNWGQEVIGSGYSLVSSGQSAYSAFALCKLNVPVSIIGNVGNDIYGQKILADLNNAGILTKTVEISPSGKTGISIAIVRPDGERAFVSDTACLSEFTTELISKHQSEMVDSEIICFVGSFFLPGLPIRETAEQLRKAQELGKKTLLDTGWDASNWPKETVSTLRNGLKYVDYFIPNMDEAFAITCERNPENALRSLLSDGVKTVVIKMGSEGSISNSNSHLEYIPAHRVDVVDAVGAGDVFNAGFLFGTLQDWPIAARMYFGSVVSALYISKSINRFPLLTDVVQTLNQWDLSPFSVEVM
jgi:ribokinase